MMEKATEVGRPLGPQELFFHTFPEEGSFQLATTMVIVSTQSCPPKLLEDACQLLAKRHPLLRMRVALGTLQRFVFEPIPEFKVNFAVDNSSSLETVMEREVVTPLGGEEGSMWKVTYLPSATPEFTTDSHPYQITLIFTISHVIADGTACERILQDFLSFLEQLHTSSEVVEVTSRPMPPDVLEFSNRYLSRKSFKVPSDSTLQHWEQAGLLQKLVNRHTWRECPRFQSEDRSPEPRVGVQRARLSKRETKALVTEAKNHHVTVTSLLTAALSMAVHRMLPAEQSELLIFVSADLRRMAAAAGFSDPDVIHQVAAQSVTFWFHPLVLNVSKESNTWMLSAQCHRELHGMGIMTKAFITLRDYEESSLSKLDVVKSGTTVGDLGLNNMGSLKSFERPETAPFKVAEISGCVGEHHIGKPVMMNAFTINGILMLTLSYSTHIVSRGMAVELMRQFVANLKKVIGE